MKRILVFLNPGIDPMGMGYQMKQILITIGSGGIFGLGLGMSVQKFGWIPQTMSDSIFAIFAEETGFVGSVVLIFLFLLLLWRGFRIAKMSQNKFSQLLAMGISCWICIQAFINIGAMIGLLPLTGIPLPFISYGGSHMVAELIGIGILLNISKSSKK
jgi:cell division protein FtsW